MEKTTKLSQEIIELSQEIIVETSGKQAAKDFLLDSILLNQYDNNEWNYWNEKN